MERRFSIIPGGIRGAAGDIDPSAMIDSAVPIGVIVRRIVGELDRGGDDVANGDQSQDSSGGDPEKERGVAHGLGHPSGDAPLFPSPASDEGAGEPTFAAEAAMGDDAGINFGNGAVAARAPHRPRAVSDATHGSVLSQRAEHGPARPLFVDLSDGLVSVWEGADSRAREALGAKLAIHFGEPAVEAREADAPNLFLSAHAALALRCGQNRLLQQATARK